MDIAIVGLIVAGVLAVVYFTRKVEPKVEPTKVEPTPIVEPYPELIEDWRRDMWEAMRWKHWTYWTEEEWQSLRLDYGDPGYEEAYIRHYGQAAWDELMLKREAYEAGKAKQATAEAEMDEFLDDVLKPGYTMEDIEKGIPQSYFTDLYGPAWAELSGTPGRIEAMRDYFLEHHPNIPLPKELEPGYLPAAPVIETPAPTLPSEPAVLPRYRVTFTDGSVGLYTAEQISDMQDAGIAFVTAAGPQFIKSVQW